MRALIRDMHKKGETLAPAKGSVLEHPVDGDTDQANSHVLRDGTWREKQRRRPIDLARRKGMKKKHLAGLGRFGFCESETCPQQSGLTFGHYDTTFDGVIEAFDGEAGHLAMDFTARMPDGSGRTLKLSVKGDLKWDATYVAPMIEDLTGSWLVSPDTVSQHWDVPFELQLRQDNTQLSGVICARTLASDSSGGLSGDGLDADGGSQVGSSSDAGIDGVGEAR